MKKKQQLPKGLGFFQVPKYSTSDKFVYICKLEIDIQIEPKLSLKYRRYYTVGLEKEQWASTPIVNGWSAGSTDVPS